jgi:hypothetical protein
MSDSWRVYAPPGKEESSSGQTIILVGGTLTTDDGATFDSRQTMDDDPRAQVAYRSLATSTAWWMTVVSLVNPLVRAVGHGFAAVEGPHYVYELRGDGAVTKVNLNALLGMGQPRSWWRFTKREPRVPAVSGRARYLSTSVLVDTSHAGEAYWAMLKSFRARERWNPNLIFVVPHTRWTEEFFRRFALAGHPEDDFGLLYQESPPQKGVRGAPLDPMQFTAVVPLEADFKVTGLIRSGEWVDHSGLEAARLLLQTRFDLELGIWDLADNSTLRRTLLKAEPPDPASTESAPMPASAVRRAHTSVAADDEAWGEWATRLAPLLNLGWQRRGRTGVNIRLPLVEHDPPTLFPILQLWLSLGRKQCIVRMQTTARLDMAAFCEDHRTELEEIAGDAATLLNTKQPVIWQVVGGRADEVDWDVRVRTLAEHTSKWVQVFSQLAQECRRQDEARARLRSR